MPTKSKFPSDASREPGYLARKFARIQREQLAERLKQEAEQKERDERNRIEAEAKTLRFRAVDRKVA